MEIFGIGPLELLFVMVLALVVLGPRDMVKAGKSMGRFLRKTILSPTWLKMQREIRNLPYQMMREAGLEENDLRIKTDIQESYRGKPISASDIPAEGKNPAPKQIPTGQAVGQLPSIPPEWLGLPTTTITPFGRDASTEEHPALESWTSPPTKEARTPEPHDEKD